METTLPLPSNDSILSQIRDLEEQGHLRVQVSDRSEPTEKDWQNIFNTITPEQLYNRIRRVAGNNNDVKLDIELPAGIDPGELSIVHNSSFERPVQHINFSITRNKEAALDNAHFLKESRGNSIAKGYLREAVGILKEIGVKEVSINANGLGGYAWAKYGFTPNDKVVWGTVSTPIKRRIDQDNNEIFLSGKQWYGITEDEKKVLNATLHSDSQYDILHITQLNRVVGQVDGHDITVGKAALIDTSWNGKLLLEDGNPGYEQFKAYTEDTYRLRQQESGIQ